MNHIRRTRHLLSGLPRRAGLLIASAAPAVLWADPPLPPGWQKYLPLPAWPQPAVRFPPGWTKHPPLPTHSHSVIIGGLPGWHTTLIVITAAVLTAATVVLLTRLTQPPAAAADSGTPAAAARTETTAVNANAATLTALTTTQTGNRAATAAPNAPASASFDLILTAVADSTLGSSGAPYTLTISALDLTAVSQGWPTQTLHRSFDAASGWKPSGSDLHYQCTQILPIAVPGGGPGGPLAGHVLLCVASLISRDAQIVSIIHSDPFVLV